MAVVTLSGWRVGDGAIYATEQDALDAASAITASEDSGHSDVAVVQVQYTHWEA